MDSFKGCLSAARACAAAAGGLRSRSVKTVSVPLADGGEGTVECIAAAGRAEKETRRVPDLFLRERDCVFAAAGDTAVIEAAQASGLDAVRRDPLAATSYGTGMLIAAALDMGFRKITVGLGGTGTCDGGTGALSALGVRFFSRDGRPLRGSGAELGEIASMDLSGLRKDAAAARFILACDVRNPFFGEDGAACVYAPQKGAGPAEVKKLDEGLRSFAAVCLKYTGRDISRLPGAGAAGGLAGGLAAALDCTAESGFDVVARAAGFFERLDEADMLVTGEGSTDRQTAFGKLPARAAAEAKKRGLRTVLISGRILEGARGALPDFDEFYSLSDAAGEEYSMSHAEELLYETAGRLAR